METNEGRYRADPGTCDSMSCGICGSEMQVKRDVLIPPGWASAMAGHKVKMDAFSCPHVGEDWHRQAVKIRQMIRETASQRIAEILEGEFHEIVDTKKCTKNEGWRF